MEKNRLEAFSDGVLAIIITIMILELKQPASDGMKDLLALAPTLLAYLLSFMFIAIYWVNHHLIFHNAERISDKSGISRLFRVFQFRCCRRRCASRWQYCPWRRFP